MLIPYLFALVFPACLIWAAISDLRTMTIPNWLSLTLAVAFVPTALLLKAPPSLFLEHLGVGLTGFVVGFAAFAFRLMGGGDAKLIAATALWFSFKGFLVLIVYIALMGGALSILIIGARFFLSIYVPSFPAWAQKLLQPKGDIPYGIAICAGGLLAASHSDLYLLLEKLSVTATQ